MDDPHLARAAILAVVSRHADNILVTDQTEAKRVLGMSGAGPLDNLPADHADEFIVPIEAEARRGRRLGSTLGCVWRNAMAGAVSTRVQRAAGDISQ